MTVDDVIDDFVSCGSTLPRESMQWALDHWDEAFPRFLDLLARCADGTDRSEAILNALFFIVHLFGDKRETRAFAPLCLLLAAEDEIAHSILGDGVTTTLGGILISAYDGDPSGLKHLIESTAADEFVRHAALGAMAWLTRAGALTDEEMRGYLLHLRAEMRPHGESMAWVGWVDAAANLGYGDYADQVDKLIRLGWVPHNYMELKHFHEQVGRAAGDPSGLGGFEDDRISPFANAIGTLSGWYGFSEQARLDEERRAAREREEKLLARISHTG